MTSDPPGMLLLLSGRFRGDLVFVVTVFCLFVHILLSSGVVSFPPPPPPFRVLIDQVTTSVNKTFQLGGTAVVPPRA